MGKGRWEKKSVLFCNFFLFFFLLLYLILQNSSPAVDFRIMNQAHYTSLINDETIAVWRQKLSEHNNANTIKYVVACFQFFSKCIGISNLVIFPYFHLEVVTINGVLHLRGHFLGTHMVPLAWNNIVSCSPIFSQGVFLNLLCLDLKNPNWWRPELAFLLRKLSVIVVYLQEFSSYAYSKAFQSKLILPNQNNLAFSYSQWLVEIEKKV